MHGAAATRRVHQHLADLAHERVAPAGGDRVLQFHALPQPLERQLSGHLPLEPGGEGPRLLGVREEPRPIELRRVEEGEQLVVVLLGLAGVPEDERGAERGAWLRPPDRRDALEEAFAVAPPAHAREQRAGDVLERQVEVRHAGGEHHFHELGGEGGGVQVQQPRAPHHPGHRLDERDERRRAAGAPCSPVVGGAVPSVRGEILGHEDDLVHRHHLGARQRSHLREDVRGRARPLGAAKRRDRTEPAAPIAAFGDLHVRPGRCRRRPREREEVEGREPGRTGWRRRGAAARRPELDRDRRRGRRRTGSRCTDRDHALTADGGEWPPEPCHEIDLGQRRSELVAVPLGHAARDDQARAGTTRAGELQHRLDRLLPGRLDERARVYDHEVGLLGARGGHEAVGLEQTGELVRVDLVLRAAERLQPVAALGHRSSFEAVRLDRRAGWARVLHRLRRAPLGRAAQSRGPMHGHARRRPVVFRGEGGI